MYTIWEGYEAVQKFLFLHCRCTAMAGKIVGVFPRETMKTQLSLAKSTWSWLFPILSKCLWEKSLQCWWGMFSQRKSSAFPLLHPLCWCPPAAIHRQLRMFVSASKMEHLLQVFFSLFRKEICTCKPITHHDTASCYSDFQGWSLMLAAYFSVLLFHVLPLPLLWEDQGTTLL